MSIFLTYQIVPFVHSKGNFYADMGVPVNAIVTSAELPSSAVTPCNRSLSRKANSPASSSIELDGRDMFSFPSMHWIVISPDNL